MTDEVVLEDIFEIGERLLAEGADPSAVVCCRGLLEHLHEKEGYFPPARVETRNGEFSFIELAYKVENYYWVRINVRATTPYQQIVGWSTYKGKVDKKEDGEVYYESSEFWYKDLDDYLDRRTRRRRRR